MRLKIKIGTENFMDNSENKPMKAKMQSPTLEKTIISAIAVLVSVFTAITLFTETNGYVIGSIAGNASTSITKTDMSYLVCLICTVIAAVSILVNITTVFLVILGRKYSFSYIASFATGAAFIVFCTTFGIFSPFQTVLSVMSILLLACGSAYLLFLNKTKNNLITLLDIGNDKQKLFSLIIGALCVFSLISIFTTPFGICYTEEGVIYRIRPVSSTTFLQSTIECISTFISFFIAFAIGFIWLLSVINGYSMPRERFISRLSGVVYYSEAVGFSYFVFGLFYCFFNNKRGGNYSTLSYIPLAVTTVLTLIFAIVSHGMSKIKDAPTKEARLHNIHAAVLFVFLLIFTAITFFSLMVNVLEVTYTTSVGTSYIKINGYEVLTKFSGMHEQFQFLAFMMTMFFSVSGGFLICSVTALFSKSRSYANITIIGIIVNVAFALFVGLMGKYYSIAQTVNEEAIRSLFENKPLIANALEVEYKVKSQSFYLLIADVTALVVMLILRPYSKYVEYDAIGNLSPVIIGKDGDSGNNNHASSVNNGEDDGTPRSNGDSRHTPGIDACPAFSDIDRRIPQFEEELTKRREKAFSSPTLPTLTGFIVDYARDSRLHLSYTREDIAAFIAGLGASKLTILQGMSGTGKTSLPKIFMEAIMGSCDIVEVESSWRDKNELLGYYNEFSKIYTPKKFTQMLYRAALNPEVVTFIVLDEMNLSRIEYYFSDFLSLMENEEDKREIKLLNVKLANTENGAYSEYTALCEGHTLKIPKNVWFVGTANRDESTFEISDKVYDRAHTINLNHRAVKPKEYGAPLEKRYLSYSELRHMLESAKNNFDFNVSSSPLIPRIEAILSPYNISFGNRIENQIENFVRIYCSCFDSPESKISEAVERIMLSKVVAKLETKSVENKSQLAAEFERSGLYMCRDFVMRLNED